MGSGDLYPYGGGSVYIDHQGRESDESVIEWSTIHYVEWRGGSPSICNSHIAWLSLESPVGASIASNVIRDLYVGRGTGKVVNNLIEHHLHLYGGSVEVTRNTLRSVADGTWGAISTCAGNTSLITENVIQDCQLGMLIFAASPELHRNNFEGNVMNLGILPEFQRPDTGTVNATNNWWGTIDTSEVASKIEYRRNGDTVSQKTVVYLPIALQPFELDTMVLTRR